MAIGQWRWRLRRLGRRLGVKVVAYALLGVATALLAAPLEPLVPASLGRRIGAEAAADVLAILASSMLAITTFSLSIVVGAFEAAGSGSTPRAVRLLREDPTSHNVLATFLGAFLFAIVGIVALRAGVYAERGQVLLFAATGGVVAMVVLAFLRWIPHLAAFGRLDDTLGRIERATRAALVERAADPWLGGVPAHGPPPPGSRPLPPEAAGYVQHVDTARLAACAEASGIAIRLEALPGSFVHAGRPLLRYSGGPLDADREAELRAAFTLGESRTFDLDPRFGLVVLAEIASRAPSPAVNDPGTAIDVLGRIARLLAHWRPSGESAPRLPRLSVPPLDAADLVADAFRPIARDGAGLVEVQVRLQKALAAVAAGAPEPLRRAALAMAQEALARAERAGLLPVELDTIRAAAGEVAVAAATRPAA